MNLNFLVELFSKTIADAGESKLKEVLQNLHDQNEAEYKAAIYGGHALVKRLRPLVEKSKTSIDDAVLGAIDDAINESAKANGIEDLEPVTPAA